MQGIENACHILAWCWEVIEGQVKADGSNTFIDTTWFTLWPGWLWAVSMALESHENSPWYMP